MAAARAPRPVPIQESPPSRPSLLPNESLFFIVLHIPPFFLLRFPQKRRQKEIFSGQNEYISILPFVFMQSRIVKRYFLWGSRAYYTMGRPAVFNIVLPYAKGNVFRVLAKPLCICYDREHDAEKCTCFPQGLFHIIFVWRRF